jgi:hypothetical protein
MPIKENVKRVDDLFEFINLDQKLMIKEDERGLEISPISKQKENNEMIYFQDDSIMYYKEELQEGKKIIKNMILSDDNSITEKIYKEVKNYFKNTLGVTTIFNH